MSVNSFSSAITSVKTQAIAWVGLTALAVSWTWLIVTNTWVHIESSDLTKLTNANQAYLGSAFQVVELIPYIAVVSWGFYVLNKMFSIIPKVGW